jgi:hypothetical protein
MQRTWTPHERTELPEVQRADEAYAGRAQHTPTRNGRRDPGLHLCGMCDHRQPHGAWLARGVGFISVDGVTVFDALLMADSRFHDPI